MRPFRKLSLLSLATCKSFVSFRHCKDMGEIRYVPVGVFINRKGWILQFSNESFQGRYFVQKRIKHPLNEYFSPYE